MLVPLAHVLLTRRLTNLGLFIFWTIATIFVLYAPREGESELKVSRPVDSMWWGRFGMSVVLYGGAVGALLILLVDVAMYKQDRVAKVVVR